MDARLSLWLRRRRRQTPAAAPPEESLGLGPKRLRAAVDELARLGFLIESHPVQGLRLVDAPPSLIAEEVAWDLAVRRVGRRVLCEAAATSTNDLAWEAAAAGPGGPDGLAIFAEYQSAGRGRRGNRWLSPAHTSILASVLLWEGGGPAQAAVLTRAATLAVAEAIEDQCRVGVGIKWPNDLVVDDRKVAGILVETRPSAKGPGPVVIGAGINCTQPAEAFPPEIRPNVASLAMLGEEVDRTLLARSFLERLDRVLGDVGDPGRAEDVRRRAAARCQTLGRRIVVSEGTAAYAGEVVDLDPDYGLVLRLPEGGIRRFGAMTTHVVGPGEWDGTWEKPSET